MKPATFSQNCLFLKFFLDTSQGICISKALAHNMVQRSPVSAGPHGPSVASVSSLLPFFCLLSYLPSPSFFLLLPIQLLYGRVFYLAQAGLKTSNSVTWNWQFSASASPVWVFWTCITIPSLGPAFSIPLFILSVPASLLLPVLLPCPHCPVVLLELVHIVR